MLFQVHDACSITNRLSQFWLSLKEIYVAAFRLYYIVFAPTLSLFTVSVAADQMYKPKNKCFFFRSLNADRWLYRPSLFSSQMCTEHLAIFVAAGSFEPTLDHLGSCFCAEEECFVG